MVIEYIHLFFNSLQFSKQLNGLGMLKKSICYVKTEIVNYNNINIFSNTQYLNLNLSNYHIFIFVYSFRPIHNMQQRNKIFKPQLIPVYLMPCRWSKYISCLLGSYNEKKREVFLCRIQMKIVLHFYLSSRIRRSRSTTQQYTIEYYSYFWLMHNNYIKYTEIYIYLCYYLSKSRPCYE